MSLITISPFTLPTDNLPDGDYVLRLWYNQSFLDSSGQLVASGSSTSGTQFRFGATVAGGFLSFDALEIYSTLDANTPYPQGINATCQVFKNNAALPIYPFNQTACPSSWIVPDDLGLSITFETWTIANQRIVLANPPQTFYTAPQVDALIEAASYAPATTTSLGLVEISANPANPLVPIALGKNDYAAVGNNGVVSLSVAPAVASSPIAVGDNDVRLPAYYYERYVTLSAAVTAIGSAQATLFIGTPTPASGTLNIPSNISLLFTDTGMITVATTKTVTIRGPISVDGGPRKIFDLQGTGVVAFTGNTAIRSYPVEWWGAKADATIYETCSISAGTDTLVCPGASFTSAIIGQEAVVTGAGVAGATFISAVTDVPSPTSLTLASTASTHALSVRGVVGTDNTPLFGTALAALTRGELVCAGGNYLFTSGGITLPEEVTLRGTWTNSPRFLGYAFAGQPKPMDSGGTVFVVAADEGTTTGRFALVGTNSTLTGIVCFYPAELSTLTTPKLYPWTVELTGSSPSLEHCNIYNPYNAVYSHIGEGHRINDVQGQPINTGLYISQIGDSAFYRQVHFAPQYTYDEGGSITPLQTWISTNGTAFKIGRVDDGSCDDCFSYGYLRGFYFVTDAPESTSYLPFPAPGGTAWFHIRGGGADVTNYCIDIQNVQGASTPQASVGGVTFDGVTFTAGQVVDLTGSGITPFALVAEATMTGRVGLNNCVINGHVTNLASSAGLIDIDDSFWQTGGTVTNNGTKAITTTGNRFIAFTVGTFNAVSANIIQSGNVFVDTFTNNAVTFQNSWANLGGGYANATYSIRDGFVYLHGAVHSGTIPAVMFTLPSGYRPISTALFTTYSASAPAGIQVDTNGEVLIGYGSNTAVSLEGICFQVP